jgi:hypothetical protein
MKEATLRDFFLGLIPAATLASEAAAATEQSSPNVRQIHIEDLEGEQEFDITAPMLVRLCDAVLTGAMPGPCLEPIGFAVIASDHLGWKMGDLLVERVIYAWASPEINWELTSANVQMFRGWLTGEIEPPPEPKLDPNPAPGRLMSTTMKAWSPPPRAAPPKDEA